ncbi:MAG: sulfite exporter TauE/SafE family protein [Aquisalimonadaceae bacterium]
MDEMTLIAGAVALAFFIGGTVKGAVGFGMPVVALPIIASFVDVRTGLALLCLPLIASNVWQAFNGGHFVQVAWRFRWMFVTLVLGCALGASMVVRLDQRGVFLSVGAVVIGYVLLTVIAPTFRITTPRERAAGLVTGLVSGVLGGFAALFGPPLIMYFSALDLSKDAFVASMGATMLLASVVVAVSYIAVGIVTPPLLGLSVAALLPLGAGLLFGEVIRRWVRPDVFRWVVLVALLLVGANLLRRGLIG